MSSNPEREYMVMAFSSGIKIEKKPIRYVITGVQNFEPLPIPDIIVKLNSCP
jgi:hypothetical protein